MEQEGKSSSSRKVRFAPKVPPRKAPKPTETKTEASEDTEASQTRELIRRVNETFGRRGAKVDKKPAVQVAFGYGGTSTSIRTYGVPRDANSSGSRGLGPQGPISDDGKQNLIVSSVYQTDQSDGTNAYSADAADVSIQKPDKEYVEPWDYYTYYPVTLPLRRPYSGNPESLDEVEFGEVLANMYHDENSVNPAAELGLTEKSEEAKMLFFQLPASLPLVKRSASAKGKEIAGSSKPSRAGGAAEKGCSLEELPAGFMGKMLVYKSGAIKMKLGEVIYDVSPGSDCVFAQDVAAINTEEKHCCVLGDLNKRAVVTPDVDSLLNSVIDLG